MQREPPDTEEGWFVLHDLRRIDWDAWREAPARDREIALAEGTEYLERYEAVEDAPEGQSAVYAMLGHKADLMIVHLRPTVAALDAAERAFEQTTFARFTERATSYVSVTEASGYTERARAYFDGEVDDDSGLAQYVRSRLHPEIPDDEFVSFYPMQKRRRPGQNWYDLPFESRADHMKRHGTIGREYAGRIRQMITSSVGMDDWEWGVTLWGEDLTDVKDLLYEMRFDPSSSRFAEFGQFYVGRRFPPADLDALLAGEPIPTQDASSTADAGGTAAADATAREPSGTAAEEPTEATASAEPTEATASAEPTASASGHADEAAAEEARDAGGHGSGGRPDVSGDFEPLESPRQHLTSLGLTAGEDYEAGHFALVFYSGTDASTLGDEVADLRESFDHYDRHVHTTARAAAGRAAAVSIWTAREAAETAAGFLGDLPDVEERLGGAIEAVEAGEPTGATEGDEATRDDDSASSGKRVADETADEPARSDDASRADTTNDAVVEGMETPDAPTDSTATDASAIDRAGAAQSVEEAPGDAAIEEAAEDAEAEEAVEDAEAEETAEDAEAEETAEDAMAEETAETAVEDVTAEDGRADDPQDDGEADDDAAGSSEDTQDGGRPDGIREQLADLDVYAGQPHGEDVYALVLYSRADDETLFEKVSNLRNAFSRYDTHVKTALYENGDSETSAVVTLWTTPDAADTAADFLSDLPGIVGRPEDDDGFGTMGMFYTVKPDHREDFVETFDTVGDLLDDMAGHRETALLVNREDENDMFIASRWDGKEDAMAFFRSEEFAETVEWGRDVLADRPRHVFLA